VAAEEWEHCGLGFIGFSCALVSSVPFYTYIVQKKGDINGEKGFNSLIFVGWRVFVTAHDMDGYGRCGNEIRAGIFPVKSSHSRTK
jgi:hypothetical protein